MARVLIVDDEIKILEILKLALQEAGHIVETAKDAATARRLLQPEAFDVVVTDIGLPDMTGVELLREIRVVEPRVPVILMTGGPNLKTATDALRASAYDYLCKPFPLEALARSVACAAKLKALDDEHQRVMAEVEHLRQAEDESERAQRAQLRMRDEFLSHVSHELRTPLTAVHQFITLLLDGLAGGLNNEQCEYLEIALRNVKQLQSLIGDLLDVTRAQSGKLTVSPRHMNVADAIHVAMNTVRHAAVSKNLSLSSQVADRLPTAFADPQRVQQIIVNLLNNAVKFTPRGGRICVRANLERVCHGVRNDEDAALALSPANATPQRAKSSGSATEALCVSVTDSGCGIAPENQKRIFEQLYQVDKTIDQSRSGLGLGLFICRDLVSRQHGKIWVESRPGEGSTFYFTLPVDKPEPAALTCPRSLP